MRYLAFAAALAGPLPAQPGRVPDSPALLTRATTYSITVSTPRFGVVIADLNNDGKLDYALGAGYGIDVALGNGDGTFQPFKSFRPTGDGCIRTAALSSAAADFDGDGNIDLVMYLGNGVSCCRAKETVLSGRR